MTGMSSADEAPPRHLFVSVVRRGAAAHVTEGPDAEGRVRVRVHVDFTQREERTPAATVTTRTADVTLPLLGAGDILGLDGRAVCRVWPKPDVMDAEPNLFPLVEFSDEDLPWRYTPAAVGSDDRLVPWVTLLVLAEGEFDIQAPTATQPLALLVPRTTATVPEMPDAGSLWAWAHTHLTPTGPPPSVAGATIVEGAEGRLRAEAGRAVARLIAPRRLRERTAYTAFVVPTFERGRRVALGLPLTNVPPDMVAWAVVSGVPQSPTVGATPPEALRLPIYYQWRFGTGQEGDFESLARRLRSRAMPPEVGRRAMDVSAPAPSVPAATAGAPVWVEAALRPWMKRTDEPWSPPWPPQGSAAFYEALRALTTNSLNEPKLTPPLYGEWPAAQHRLAETLAATSRSGWFDELNADPRTRVAAGMGTAVVQKLQEELMASAWQQAEGIRRINETLRFTQVAREASKATHRDLARAPLDTFFRLVAPVLTRVRVDDDTARAHLARSPIPTGVLQGTWRRLARPRGAHRARGGRTLALTATPDFLSCLNAGTLAAARPPTTPSGLATPLGMLAALGAATPAVEALRAQLAALSSRSSFAGALLFSATGLSPRGDASWLTPAWRELREGVGRGVPPNDPRLLSSLTSEGPAMPDFEIIPPPRFDLQGTAAFGRWPKAEPGGQDNDTARALRRAFGDLAQHLGKVPPTDPPATPVDLPTLRELVLKALDPETTFVDAIRSRLHLSATQERTVADPLEPILVAPDFPQPMVDPLGEQSQDWILPGLDKVPRDTALLMLTNRRFVEAYMVGLSHEMSRELLWNEYPTDQRGTYFRRFWRARDADVPRDITPVHEWRSTPLGEHGMRPDSLVLLLRSELLRRYPTAIIYATHTAPGGAVTEHIPIFTGTLAPDVTYVGFDITSEHIESDMNAWAFVIEEQPGEPRFGVDAPATPPSPAAAADTRYHAPPTATSAGVAARWFRPPTRVVMRASTLLRPAPPEAAT